MSRRPGLRARLALMSAAAVAVAIAAVAILAWWTTSQVMLAQIDSGLREGPLITRLARVIAPEWICQSTGDRPPLPAELGSVQLVRADGTSCADEQSPRVPIERADIEAANGGPATALRDATTSTGLHVRLTTVPVGRGYAVMVWRDLTEFDNTLRTLAFALLLVGGLGALGALIAGWAVARAGLRPLDDLTMAAEHVAATQDLNVPIAVSGTDEVARLGGAFNKMTSALDAARQRHQQVIADAGHELRTPLTSLRTNIELLVRSEEAGRALSPVDRRDLLHSLSAQLQELSHLTGELSLLTHAEPAAAPAPLRLDEVVRRAVGRASRRGRHHIVVDLQPWVLVGEASALERAVLNLLDNAIKFAPGGSTVTVILRDGVVSVSDQGPGVPEFERPQVFQRFWRSPTARSMSGSGLGLSIVADVAATHGGQVDVGESPEGGARFSIRLPGSSAWVSS